MKYFLSPCPPDCIIYNGHGLWWWYEDTNVLIQFPSPLSHTHFPTFLSLLPRSYFLKESSNSEGEQNRSSWKDKWDLPIKEERGRVGRGGRKDQPAMTSLCGNLSAVIFSHCCNHNMPSAPFNIHLLYWIIYHIIYTVLYLMISWPVHCWFLLFSLKMCVVATLCVPVVWNQMITGHDHWEFTFF